MKQMPNNAQDDKLKYLHGDTTDSRPDDESVGGSESVCEDAPTNIKGNAYKNVSEDASKVLADDILSASVAYSKPKHYVSGGEKKKGMGAQYSVMFLCILFMAAAVFSFGYLLFGEGGNGNDIVRSDFSDKNTPVPKPPETIVPSPTSRPMTQYDGVLPVVTETSNPFPEIIETVQNSVVSVCNYTVAKNIFGKEGLVMQGSGTGFVISTEGYVITNAHVIKDAQKVTLYVSKDVEVDCEVIGSDTTTDIAVLKFDNSVPNIVPLYLGDSDTTKVGEFVITVGDPSGLELAGTITFGMVSAVNRSVNIDGRTNVYIQTDAAMNPGNSGGPLINIKGEVIGVNSAKTVTASYDDSGNAISAEGLGFAIPINTVKSIAEGLITMGRIQRPGIGLTIAPATDEELYSANLTYGLTVHELIVGGPAYKAGIQAGDILINCDGKELHENNDLTQMIAERKIGDTLKIELVRNTQKITVNLTIGDLNAL